MGQPTAPDYDNVRLGGPDGLRYPLELGTGTFLVKKEININIGTQGASNIVTLGANNWGGSYYRFTNASGAASIKWPGVFPGFVFTIFNNSGQTVTCLVTGQTGITVANGKRAILVHDEILGDIARVTADT